MTLSAFGQKERDAPINLVQWIDPQAVQELYVHVGVNIKPLARDNTLLWSKQGLRQMGLRGEKMYTSLALADCGAMMVKPTAHTATSLLIRDLRPNLHPTLAAIIGHEATYLQMYNNSPHYRPKECHAISGLQAASLCVHAQVGNSIIALSLMTLERVILTH